MRITDLLQQLKIPFCQAGSHHHVREGWIGVNCPWCPQPLGPKGKWRLGIEISSGRCNCWTCGGHKLSFVLATLAGVPHVTASDYLSDLTLTKLPQHKTTGRLTIPSGVGALTEPHRRYLLKRGFNPDHLVKLWGIGGIGLNHHYAWRLYIPIQLNNQTVSWTTRSIGQKGYLSAPPTSESVPLKETLYGIDLIRTTVIICEGPTDVWRIGPGAVATFGVVVTPHQISLLSHFPYRIVCFDHDRPGQRAAHRLANHLSCFPGTTEIAELPYDDPGSASPSSIKLLRLAVGLDR